MLPEKKTNQNLQLFELSENKVIREKQLMLQVPEAKAKLSVIENSIAEATIKPIVKEMPDQYLIDKLKICLPMICRDLGIKNWNNENEMQYSKARFFQTLRRYYPNLTIESIKIAFELLAVGQLDEYLPKDKNGNPDKNHYQEFSFEFYTRILNAYQKKTSEVWSKVRLAIPKVETVISESQIKANETVIINEIYKAFDEFEKNKDNEPNFDLAVHLNYLVEYGLIEKSEPENESIKKAYNRLLFNNYLSKLEKKKMIDEYAQKRHTHQLKTESERIENNQTIKKYFQNLIENKKNIRDYLKQK